ncbi:MAG: hypothetical protein ACRCVI_00845 [Mycoplasmoidaceae bacterium]
MDLFPNSFSIAKFLEPSAGTGNFLVSLNKFGVDYKRIEGYDLDPKHESIKNENYLLLKKNKSKKRIIIGNPPFGKRGKVALEFLNKGLKEANIVCFILPNIFNRYSIQKLIDQDAKLIYIKSLNANSFILNDREYKVNCVFQIWAKEIILEDDYRIKSIPKIKHDDFITYIHNNTEETLKYFNKKIYKWDFAVHRQGYYDYSIKISDPKKLIKNRQYFFIKAKNNDVLKIIKEIDFVKLSKTNTQVWGFSTSDFVKEYEKIKGKTDG